MTYGPALSELSADCEVACPCCTGCYDSTTGRYVRAAVPKCRAEIEFSADYLGGASCTCDDDKNTSIVDLSCAGRTCLVCNKDNTICGNTTYFGNQLRYDRFSSSSYWVGGKSIFQYTIGRNETVEYEELLGGRTGGIVCEVKINGEACASCNPVTCRGTNRLPGILVRCNNIEGAGDYDPCSGNYEDFNSPLAVFSFEDPSYRSNLNCPPIFPFGAAGGLLGQLTRGLVP